MRPVDLESLRSLLDTDNMELKLAVIEQLEVAKDRSVLFAKVRLLPESHRIIARLTWDLVGPEAGLYQFPSKDDLVLVGFCEGHVDEAYVLRRLTSSADKIPIQAVNGHLVCKALAGTKAFLNSDTEINLTRENPGNERLVLGDTFKAAYAEHLDIDSTHTHMDIMGYLTDIPTEAADYVAILESPVEDELMLSDLAKTEK